MTPLDIRRAYGCPHQVAYQMWQHLYRTWPSLTYASIFRLGPLRCHWFENEPYVGNGSKWHVDNKPVTFRELRHA